MQAHLPPPAAPEQFGAAWQSQQLCLWLVASMAHLPDTALAGLGLDSAALGQLRVEHATDIEALRQLQAGARLMSRDQTAELLRCRVNGMALAARTPSELAAVARTVRTLPDWVWEGALAATDAPRSAAPASPAAAAGRLDPPFFLTEQWARDALLGAGPAPLNRQQRRAAESRGRKQR